MGALSSFMIDYGIVSGLCSNLHWIWGTVSQAAYFLRSTGWLVIMTVWVAA